MRRGGLGRLHDRWAVLALMLIVAIPVMAGPSQAAAPRPATVRVDAGDGLGPVGSTRDSTAKDATVSVGPRARQGGKGYREVASPADPDPSPPHQWAEQLDRFYLGTVVLPEGSRRSAPVAPLSGIPDSGGQAPCAGGVVSRDRYWIVPVGRPEFDAFIAGHPPIGFTPDQHGRPWTEQRPDVSYSSYSLNEYVGDVLTQERIVLLYTPVNAGSTAVRAMASSAGTVTGCYS